MTAYTSLEDLRMDVEDHLNEQVVRDILKHCKISKKSLWGQSRRSYFVKNMILATLARDIHGYSMSTLKKKLEPF